jgi:glutamine synthetase
MGTDAGSNLLEPGDTPNENLSFLFFAAAVIQAVDIHQQLLRASIASPGQDFRLGANEAPPAIISIFLGTELEGIFGAIAEGKASVSKPGSFLGLGTPVLPPLPLHSGDRNRTSPFAFTGNKFEFRALGSSMSPSWPNTVLNTIAAEAIDRLAGELDAKIKGGATLEKAILEIVRESYKAHSRIVFNGDNYAESWHKEAEKRGLANLRSTPDALPWLVDKTTVDLFKKQKVLSKRELESRYDVFTEQYSTKVGIEAETAASMARTLILPAALRHLIELKEAGIEGLIAETEELVEELVGAIHGLERVNSEHPDVEAIEHAIYMRDEVVPAMDAARAASDKLERIVADDLWPLPKYSEMLFIK